MSAVENCFSEDDVGTLLGLALASAASSEATPHLAKTLVELCTALGSDAAMACQLDRASGAVSPTYEVRWGSAATLGEVHLVLGLALQAAREFQMPAHCVTCRADLLDQYAPALPADLPESRRARIISTVWSNETTILCGGVSRVDSNPPFSDREVALARAIFQSACWRPVRPPINSIRAEPGLPPRAREVLELLKSGCAEKGIASELGISHHTVHCHIKRIYGHYGVGSRGELFSLLLRPVN